MLPNAAVLQQQLEELQGKVKGVMKVAPKVLMRVARRGYRAARRCTHHALTTLPSEPFPAGGLDASVVQSALFALQQTATGPEDDLVSFYYLVAVQLVQVASDRILHEMHSVEHHLRFWERQMQAGAHFQFMLLQRGPVVFAKSLLSAVGLRAQDPLNATDKMQQRVLLLHSIFTILAEALAQVHHAADLLRLNTARTELAPVLASIGRRGHQGQSHSLHQLARHAVHECSEAVRHALEALEGKLAGLTSGTTGANTNPQLQRAALLQTMTGTVCDRTGQAGPGDCTAPAAAEHGTPAAHPAVGQSAAAAAAAAAPALAHAGGHGAPVPDYGPEALALSLQALQDQLATHLADLDVALTQQALLQPPTGQQQQPWAQAWALAVARQASARVLQLLPPHVRATFPFLHRLAEGAGTGQGAGEQQAQPLLAAAPAAAATAGDGNDDEDARSTASEDGQHVLPGPKEYKSYSAHMALVQAHAAAQACKAGPLVRLPGWARMPSRLERQWVQASVLGVASLLCVRFLVNHSRLAGSDDLERWASLAVTATQDAFDNHIVQPLKSVQSELFRTFRDRQSIVSPQEFLQERDSLAAMLQDFVVDHDRRMGRVPPRAEPADSATCDAAGGAASSAASAPAAAALPSSATTGSGAAAAAAQREAGAGAGSGAGGDDGRLAEGMCVVMDSYRDQLRSPLRNLVVGELARALLIQVQRLKVDTAAAMLELDKILRANELSISLVAAVPALALVGSALTATYRFLRPRAPDMQREAVPCRMALAALERALGEAVEAQEQGQGQGQAAGGVPAELEGRVVYRLFMVFAEVQALYRHADRSSRYSEWPGLQLDLALLARPAPLQQRMALQGRLARTYRIFQP